MLDSSVNYFWTNKSNAFDVEMENNICHLLVSDMPRLGKQIEKTCLDNQCDIGTWRLLKGQNILHECCLWVRGVGRSEFQIWTVLPHSGQVSFVRLLKRYINFLVCWPKSWPNKPILRYCLELSVLGSACKLWIHSF